MEMIQEYFDHVYDHIPNIEMTGIHIWVTITATLAVIIVTILHYHYKQIKKPNVEIRLPDIKQTRGPRFRKRDKMQFFARKVLRKGKDAASRLQRQASAIKEGVSVPEYSRSGRRLHKRERMYILAKKMFRVNREPPKLLKKELPPSMLEADLSEDFLKPNLPEEVMYLLQSVKVFGHFEKGIFLQLCRHMEILKIEKDKYLFRVGDPDEFIYVIQEGQVNLYIVEDSLEIKLSEFTTGESLHSLLSILDVLTGHSAPYKTVFARAVENSTVIRLPVEAFNIAFENRQDALVQIVQVVMTRMQRVTFLALHNYLGLSQELLTPAKNVGGKTLSIHKLSQSRESFGTNSQSSFDEIETIQEDDEVDAAVFLEKPPPIKEVLPRNKSNPIMVPEKSKKLRFGEFDTVVDDNDNVFHRQTSLPAQSRQRQQLADLLKQTSSETAARDLQSQDGYMKNFSRHRNSILSAPIDTESNLTYGIDKKRLVSQESFEDANTMVELNEPEILELVIQDMLKIFGIDNHAMLLDNVTLLKVPQNFELIQEGDQDVSLYFVVTGTLSVYQAIQDHEASDETRNVNLFHAHPGMLTGQLAVLTGEPSFFSARAVKNSIIAKLKRNDFYTIMQEYPRMVLNTAHTVVQRVSKFTRQIDFALDWTMVEAGKALYKQETLSDCMYIILHGRLRSVREVGGGKKELVAEYGRGELVGMMEALRGTSRTVSMHAVRDTELAKIPEGLLKHIRQRHPGVVSHLVSLMSDKLIGSMMSNRQLHRSHPAELLSHKHHISEETKFAYGDVSNHLANLSTVAVLPASRHVPVDKFTMELEHALSAICDQVLHMNSDTIRKRLGQNALDSANEYRLTGWLAQQEDLHRIVLYQTDTYMSDWTKRCVRQSDAVLIVALGDAGPEVGELEQELEIYSVRALKVLVLLHRPEVSQPTRTADWLNVRGWLTEHLHIKASKRVFTKTRKSKLREYREKLEKREVDRFSDFSRLARFLTGTSVALVLGGGGARGIAQIGIIKCLLEAGIPIDMVGGTSIGSFMGALWASHRDLSMVQSQTAIFSSEMGSFLPKIFDLTYPITSMFSGSSFNNGIHMIFKETQIEDLWLPYFAITTDITSPKMRVHTDGSLWRYIRASMSLSGYLPPICDPKDGHLLMDGGYINNLPGDVAKSRGACRVIAVNVGAATETDFTNYGDHLSGWWLLWKKWTGRWTGHVRIPDMNDIQSRLSYISCFYLMDLVIHSDYCTYLRPPVTKYTTLEFSKWKEILEIGYEYGRENCTEEWGRKFWNDLHNIKTEQSTGSASEETMTFSNIRRKSSIANLKGNTSFTDLSELLRRKTSDAYSADLSDTDYELGYDSSPENIGAMLLGQQSDEQDGVVSDGDTSNFHSMMDVGSTSEEEEDDAILRKFSSQKVLSSSL
uniref:patatin-like phospholipase domain-containing protein 6 n=1 Tax=Styela clava TaxID=7725 RepID=UPI00193A8263|nr:patatin-like phospholipase domain-containing protein 6 [Styela clava]